MNDFKAQTIFWTVVGSRLKALRFICYCIFPVTLEIKPNGTDNSEKDKKAEEQRA